MLNRSLFLFFLFFLFWSGIIYSGMAETGPVQPVLKPVRNTTIFVLVYALVRNMPAIPTGTYEIVFLGVEVLVESLIYS